LQQKVLRLPMAYILKSYVMYQYNAAKVDEVTWNKKLIWIKTLEGAPKLHSRTLTKLFDCQRECQMWHKAVTASYCEEVCLQLAPEFCLLFASQFKRFCTFKVVFMSCWSTDATQLKYFWIYYMQYDLNDVL